MGLLSAGTVVLEAQWCLPLAPTPRALGLELDQPAQLQFWLQLAAFTVIRSRTRPYFCAGHAAYGTMVDGSERDHDGLAVGRVAFLGAAALPTAD